MTSARTVLLVFSVVVLLNPLSSPAEAGEWYFGALVGGAFPSDTNVRGTSSEDVTTTTFKARDARVDSSPVFGAKGGLCPGLLGNFCLELEFDHLRPKIRKKAVDSPLLSGQTLSQLDLGVWSLGPNVIGRLGFFSESGYPLETRLHLYLGVGPAFIWTRGKHKDPGLFVDAPMAGKTDTDFSVGVQSLAGLKYFMTKNVAVFAEYQFNHWSPEFKFSATGPGGFVERESWKTKVNAHMFYVGLAVHFN